VIYAAAAGAFTIKNGDTNGTVLLTQTFPTGHHVMNIPDDGIIASAGVYIDAFTGAANQLTIILSYHRSERLSRLSFRWPGVKSLATSIFLSLV
jgi:hypothetical protein